MSRYVLAVDQSTQGTKAMLFSEDGAMICRADRPHRQIITDCGWVEHDPCEIYANTIQVVKDVAEKAGIDKKEIAVLGISNQRETSVCWNRSTGKPIYNAIVWQCARGAAICDELQEHAEAIRTKTGLKLSPYFPAAKLAWIMRNVPEAAQLAAEEQLAMGTIDSWLVHCLTGGKRHQTDYSNASRTQLFNIHALKWDSDVLKLFGIPESCMPQVTDSDGDFGETDFEGWLDQPIPIRGVLGDSHGALFGQGCLKPGMIKATYGTGSSIMMNIGEKPALSNEGVVTSLAWKIGGRVNYVLEGNINYTGAVITWLKDNLQLISSPKETAELAAQAAPGDTTYLVPAFTGLGAPYWDSYAKASFCGMSRTTGRCEIVRAGLECIAYQITDIVKAMERSAGIRINELRVDGGPTGNPYLMQFQSDILNIPVSIPSAQELSGIGAAYAAGLSTGLFTEEVLERLERTAYQPVMPQETRGTKYAGWLNAVQSVRQKG